MGRLTPGQSGGQAARADVHRAERVRTGKATKAKVVKKAADGRGTEGEDRRQAEAKSNKPDKWVPRHKRKNSKLDNFNDSFQDAASFGIGDKIVEKLTGRKDETPESQLGNALGNLMLMAPNVSSFRAFKALNAAPEVKQIGRGAIRLGPANVIEGEVVRETVKKAAPVSSKAKSLVKGLKKAEAEEFEQLMKIPANKRTSEQMRRIKHLREMAEGKKVSPPTKKDYPKIEKEDPRKPRPKITSLAEYKKAKG